MSELEVSTDNKDNQNGTQNGHSENGAGADMASPTASDVASPVSSTKSPRRPTYLSESQSQFLEKRIAGRPSAASLENANVLKPGGRHAAAKASLQQEMTSRLIAKHIDSRPDHSELVKAGLVDTSVAPVLQSTAKKLERQIIANTLNQKLGDRAAPEEVPSHILKNDGVAPRLKDAKYKLQHAITRDQVSHLLESRPDVSELVRQNILQQQTSPTSPTSSRIQGIQKQLQHHMTTDRVSHLLEKRSEPDMLQSQNILKDPRIAPALQGVQRTLQQNLAKANLYHALKQRPSIDELQKRGIYTHQDYEGEADTADQETGPDFYDLYESKNDAQRAAAQAYAQAYASQLQAHARHQRSYSSSAATSYTPAAPAQPAIHLPPSAQRKRTARGSVPDAELSDHDYHPPTTATTTATTTVPLHHHHTAARNSYGGPTHYQQAPPASAYLSTYEPLRRSKAFHLTRILLKSVAAMAQAGEISLQQKSFLKDLIVDQDRTILAVAETFDADQDVLEFKDSLCRLAARRGGV